ncbi:hypothetical protein [Parvibaculum sp.]|uniref:hypothetical protein n=1 Tax=Parvibaculum sp. TaxID=2024848 RepID=UPI003C767B82
MLKAANTHSQSGEDGVLAAIFDTLGIECGTFCEFGAWDGKHLSNCFALYEKGWGGWYIEGDRKRFTDLKRNIAEPRAEPISAFVRATGESSLDNLLSQSTLFQKGTRHLDLLSIDIDSDDLAVWRGVKLFRPKVVVIEFNPTIPTDVYFENTPGENEGNSPRSIYEFARSVDYDLIAVVGANLIFIDRTLAAPFTVLDLGDPAFATGPRYFFGMNGTLFVSEPGKSAKARAPEILKVPWVGGVFPQPVDRPFRKFDPGAKTRITLRILSYLKMALTNPAVVLKRALR